MRLTREEKDAVIGLVCAMEVDAAEQDEIACFWWNYGIKQASQALPWDKDNTRANYLYTLANRLYWRRSRTRIESGAAAR